MSNLHLFLSLAGFMAAIFTWFRFDINKRIDDLGATMNQHFENLNNRFTDLTGFVNKRIDDLLAAPKQAA